MLVLVDTRDGLQGQCCQHTFLASLLGVYHLMLAVNKMSLVDWEKKFEAICD